MKKPSRNAYKPDFWFFQLIGPQFIWAMQPALEDQWNTELEEAWSDLFKMMAYVMKNAMQF